MIKPEEQEGITPYKYKDLKVYASTEWLAGNRKKYRQVFEQDTTSYIYVELTLINKAFELRSWDAEVRLVCYKLGKTRKEICKLEMTRQISKHDHVVYIREGWGHKEEGSFWKDGKYCWEAYVDDRKVASKYFYIQNLKSFYGDRITEAITVKSIEYYEGKFDQSDEAEEHVYFVEFAQEETRYVFVDITIENLLEEQDWFSEIFIRFFNQGRELKGEVVRLQKMKKSEDLLQITAGWGSNVKGSWRKGRYSVEIVFQDSLIAESSFYIGEEFREGDAALLTPTTSEDGRLLNKKGLTGKEAFRLLNKLVGLREVKRQISEHTQYIKFLQLRAERGLESQENMTLHCVFSGNPGTGKTTVARLMGAIYHSMGLLSKGHVHEVDRVDLVGEYIGQTAPKVKDALEKAKGGVLFIDEAYSLARSTEDSKDFGREVIELLVKEMGNPKSEVMVIVAGYPEQMKGFMNSNPGLKSRFKYHYSFEDFSLGELFRIVDTFCEKQAVLLTDKARTELENVISTEYRARDKTFGNARYIGQLLESAKINMGIRVMRLGNNSRSDQDLSTVGWQDILKLKTEHTQGYENIKIDEKSLNLALDQLNGLIGLESIKEKINQLVDVVRFRISRGQSVTNEINMHTILVGNPGTGKTTVARILADIFKALGILSRGHIVETDRQGLVAGFVGQTAIKTAAIVDRAKGGVLFIDEAYALTKSGAHNDFGDEAIQTLLKLMEDRRGQFFVFVAGYPNEMNQFLSTNPGLKSRFDHYLSFQDFSPEELQDIAQFFIRDRGYRISNSALEALSDRLQEEHQKRDKHFGNARRVRQYINELFKQQNLRLGKEKLEENTRYQYLIKEIDVQNTIESIQSEKEYQRQTIGF